MDTAVTLDAATLGLIHAWTDVGHATFAWLRLAYYLTMFGGGAWAFFAILAPIVNTIDNMIDRRKARTTSNEVPVEKNSLDPAE